jgi:glycosyltransferase involved in cell wall biosynthesis
MAPDKIRVAVDAEHTRQSAAGTTRYSRSLVAALRMRSDVDVIEIGGGPLLTRGTLRKRANTLRQDFVWYPWLGRRRAAEEGADVYHCPIPRAPLTKGKPPLVVTVHDLVPVLFPETMTPWSRAYGRATLKPVLRAADVIVTPSQDTANDLNRLLGVTPERIRVVLNGVDEIFFSTALPAPPPEKPFVLFVGSPEPRKNLPRLIEAVALLRSRGYPHQLLVVGGGGWGAVDLNSDLVTLAGQVSDERLHTLYSQAACLALPSLHEGFGLPAAEAMAAGGPVVAGRSGALPEIVGNAAVLVDPFDVLSIAEGIERAFAEKERLVSAGRERARIFTWPRAAEEMTKVYRSLL